MRRHLVELCLLMVVFFATLGNAQVSLLPNAPPAVTAASADWQIRGGPVFYAGSFYDPDGPTVFFDGFVMVRVGQYRGVPLFEDATLPAYDRVYLPIGRNVMRPYTRRPDREASVVQEPPVVPESVLSAVGTSERVVPEVTSSLGVLREPLRTRVQSIPAPSGNRGIWIEYAGIRWHSAGPAVPYSEDRFVQIGEHGGFSGILSRSRVRLQADRSQT
jgi:hypothetical protein